MRLVTRNQIMGSGFNFQLHAAHGFGARISVAKKRPCWSRWKERRGNPIQAAISRKFWSVRQANHHQQHRTFAAVPWIIRNGAQAYLECGKPNNGGTKIFLSAGMGAAGEL